jgi:protein phosphatase
MTLALRYAVRSDVGLLREGNEDSAYAGPHLLAIADGMGGHAAGEVASAVAITALAGLDDDIPGIDMLGALADAVAKANARLQDMGAADPSVEGMGTTLTAMLWSGSRMALCHIGDSRGYLLRGDDFQQITRDHTLVQSLLDEGRISADEAATHPQRSLILRALDSRTDAEPDLSLREARAGDRYLLCSDGLSDVVTEETLHRTLAGITDPDEVVIALVDLANRAGGPDNITCIVADVLDSATTRVPPSEVSVVAGAVSNQSGRQVARADTPANRARLLTQPALDDEPPDDEPPDDGGPGDGHLDGHGHQRRWPIVTTTLVVLLVVIVGGGFAAWSYTQRQYYVGESSGQVVIFRGVNQKVAGISLSSVYSRTGIPIGQVTTDDRQQVLSTITATSLANANKIVSNIRQGAQACQRAAVAQQHYQIAEKAYQQALRVYQTRRHKHGTAKTGPAPKPPASPAAAPLNCPTAASGGSTGAAPGSSGSPSTTATSPSAGSGSSR